MFGLPGEVYVVLDEGPDLEPLLASNERLVAELARTAPGVAIQGASTLLPSAAAQRERAGIIRSAGVSAAAIDRDLAEAGGRAGFRADTFDPFRARLPRLLDTAAAAHVRRLARARAGRSRRPVRRARRARLAPGVVRVPLVARSSERASEGDRSRLTGRQR